MTEQINREGLSREQVSASRNKYGENVLTPPKKTSLWKLYIDKYRDPIIEILLVAAAISLVLAFINNDFMETLGIFLAIFLATTVGFYFEVDAAKKFNVLTAMNDDQPVKVRREGKVMEIPRREVVVGDIILVEVGDEIPADAQLLSAVNLQVDESALTGEPLTTKSLNADDKDRHAAAYPTNIILRSTMVMNGHGEAVVEKIGDSTEIGKVARQSTEVTHTKTPLNIQLGKLASLISKFGFGVAIAAFVIFLVHDILTNDLWHTNNYFGMAQVVLNYFMMAVTLIVMAVPEGLPMAVNLALALNMRRMLKSHNLVRKLQASETMGAVTVICTDKTGTLTQNKMRVGDVYLTPETADNDNEKMLLKIAMAVNSTAELDGDKVVGNPTEGALLLWLKSKGNDYLSLRAANPSLNQLPFSTERKLMATAATVGGRTMTFVKGAPEMILNLCDCCAQRREACEQVLLDYQHRAMRTLAFAYGEGDLTDALAAGKAENLKLQGVCAISDPVREEVPAAVEECRTAGIRVKIVTGDTTATALEIGRQIGIEGGKAITGPEWAALSDEDAYALCEDIDVMSRARPGDKQRLVEMLQKHGEVVAVTGDGTNDAPALNYAHVGLSLGSGTSVAKQASDITILDDSFTSIASAVMWGRSLYKNIQRFLLFQLTVNVAACLLVLCGAFMGTESPLTVTQMLWVNLIMDTFAAIALSALPPQPSVMNEKPRDPHAFILDRSMLQNILGVGIMFFIILLLMLIIFQHSDVTSLSQLVNLDLGKRNPLTTYELTLIFTTFVITHMGYMFNARAYKTGGSGWNLKGCDGFLLIATIVTLGQVAIVQVPLLNDFFNVEPLSLHDWLIIIVLGFMVSGVRELYALLKKK